MKISRIFPCNNLAFGARKKEIRKADDIRRRAVNEFPMLSATRFQILGIGSKEGASRSREIKHLNNNLAEKISVVRFLSGEEEKERGLPLIPKLELIKRYKCGNCAEAAIVTLAAMRANGYKESRLSELYLKTRLINTKTGKVEEEQDFDMDHIFVTTATDKSYNPRDSVIVDSWAGFTESYSGAIDKYKGIYSDKTEQTETIFLEQLKRKNPVKFSIFFKNNYTVKSELFFKSPDYESEFNYARLGAYAEVLYPGLTQNSQKKKFNRFS